MTHSIVKGYAALAAGQQLVPITYEAPQLGEHDIRVNVTHCGLCYSDIHAIDDLYNITTYPFVPGHEIVGFVSETGRAECELKLGDRVGIGWQGRSCGTCEWCQCGEEQLCRDVAKNGVWIPYGGFATSVTVDSRFAYRLPDNMSAEDASVLLCSGLTVYNSLSRCRTSDAQKIGILGIGGLGHLAIQFAHALGYHITVMSTSDSKKEEAMSFGSDQFICMKEERAFSNLTETFDLLFCTAHGDIQWRNLFESMKIRGKIIMMGFANVAFNPTDLVVHELTIQGSFVGNRTTMREMLEFAQLHHIKPIVEQLPINQAIQYIGEHLDADIQLSDIAAHVNMSLFHFSRLFKKKVGHSPYHYLLISRIDKAKMLLKSTDHAIKEIAQEVGFNSETNFISAFSSKVGISPQRFREFPL